MFAKVFTQILDSSIAEDYQTRHVFEDLLKLCDINGVVDMTAESIARRTNAPLEMVKRGIAELEKPDPRSRTPDHEGRRIIRIVDNRDWGWIIVNYDIYRAIESEEQRRSKTKIRMQKLRERRRQPELINTSPVTQRDAPVTQRDAGDGMQRQMQRQKDFDKASAPIAPGSHPSKPTKANKLSNSQKEIAGKYETALGIQWTNDAGKWIGRIKSDIDKAVRVIAEVESAIKENRVNTTPAQYAEQIWKEFAP